jgi:predicted Rossmann fold flavoprotein
MSRFSPADFIALVEAHQIPYHEKKLGQLFCDGSAQAIVTMLRTECLHAQARFLLGCTLHRVSRLDKADGPRFRVDTSQGVFESHSLVVATGGLSLPKIGATGLGHDLARQFGLRLTPLAPALDGFTLPPAGPHSFTGLSGIATEVCLSCNGVSFRENLLFTHAGLSGPAALQGSLYWNPGDSIFVDFLPSAPLRLEHFLTRKRSGVRSEMRTLVGELLPQRLADRLCQGMFAAGVPLPQVSERTIEEFCKKLHHWEIQPLGTVGYSKAEVTRGGVDTEELSSKTLESKKVPGLYFVGEVVDVTGWLGGYNFQWAWASGWAAGQVV